MTTSLVGSRVWVPAHQPDGVSYFADRPRYGTLTAESASTVTLLMDDTGLTERWADLTRVRVTRQAGN